MSEKKERIEKYRKWIQERLGTEAWGYAEADVVIDGVTYRIGQAAATAYDALDALSVGIKFMQKELGVLPAAGAGTTPPSASRSTSTSTTAADTDTMPVETIKLGGGGENPFWYVQGGNWKKHGVPCWNEVLAGAGILDSLDPFKDNHLSGWTAIYRKKDNGNPDKVVDFIRDH